MIKLQASAEVGAEDASKDAGWTPEAVQHTAFSWAQGQIFLQTYLRGQHSGKRLNGKES